MTLRGRCLECDHSRYSYELHDESDRQTPPPIAPKDHVGRRGMALMNLTFSLLTFSPLPKAELQPGSWHEGTPKMAPSFILPGALPSGEDLFARGQNFTRCEESYAVSYRCRARTNGCLVVKAEEPIPHFARAIFRVSKH